MLISSLANPRVKFLVKLKQRRARDEHGLTLIDGCREVRRAREAGAAVEEVYLCPEWLERSAGPEARAALPGKGVKTYEVTTAVYQRIGFGDRRDGVVAVCRTRRRPLAECRLAGDALAVIVEGVEKPGNLGAILRSCDGAGAQAVFLCDTATDLFNPNVIRASMATVFSVPVFQASAEEIASVLERHGVAVYAATPSGRKHPAEADFRGPVALAVGSEDEGLSSFWMQRAREKIAIPMKGIADSLNVSVSTAVLLYEAVRQRTVSIS